MGNISLFVLLLIFTTAFLIHYSYSHEVTASKREALESVIGGGGGGGGGNTGNASSSSPECGECQTPRPPPPPPPCPPPPLPPPLSPPPPPVLLPQEGNRLKKAKTVLLKFKQTVCDPGGQTSNWKISNYVCKFNGIHCAKYPNEQQQAVAGLDFNGYAFSAALQKDKAVDLFGSLAQIPELAFFHVNSNNFSGQIPPQISNFTFFYELDLSNNKIYGEFPKDVIQSKQLVFLDLRFNQLYGSIPPQLFKLQLDVIFINNNQLTGIMFKLKKNKQSVIFFSKN